MKSPWCEWLLIAIAVCLACQGCGRSSTHMDRRLIAASTLLGQFETIYCADGDLLLDLEAYRGLPKRDSNALRVPFADLLEALESPNMKPLAVEALQGTESILVGAKGFRPPKGLGSVRSTFCYVLLLKHGSQFNVGTFFESTPTKSSGGVRIWSWSHPSRKPNEGERVAGALFVVQVKESYLVISNGIKELEEVSQGLQPNEGAMNFERIPEWSYLNKHSVWAYRSYRHRDATQVLSLIL